MAATYSLRGFDNPYLLTNGGPGQSSEYARPDQEGGFAAVDLLLENDVSAVFCHNDRVAMGV